MMLFTSSFGTFSTAAGVLPFQLIAPFVLPLTSLSETILLHPSFVRYSTDG